MVIYNHYLQIINKSRAIFIRSVIGCTFVMIYGSTLFAEPNPHSDQKTLLILHTNDIHDHVRVDYDGIGGIPFISGFVRDVRAKRDDVIVLDAGDISEKGDIVARLTQSDLTFRTLSRVGYTAWAPGNHDYDFGLDALRRFSEVAEADILCINLVDDAGTPIFEPSRVYTINGLRIGVIGAITPQKKHSLNLEETARALAIESKRLVPHTDIIIALVHISINVSAEISLIAPDIDVFVTGHSHEVLHEPFIVDETEAILVQAGSYANYVGHLELTIDIIRRTIDSYSYKLVAMDHLSVSPDLEMIEWVRQKELELVPESQRVVSWSPRIVTYREVGMLAAKALKSATDADIGFNHTGQVIRSTLPAGVLDWNSVYRTGGERGQQLIEIELLGSEIYSYLQGLFSGKWYPTQYYGLHCSIDNEILDCEIEMDKMYRVIMPEREWEKRFLNLFRWLDDNPQDWPGVRQPERNLVPNYIDISWTEAMVRLLDEWKKNGMDLLEGLFEIIQETGQDNQVTSSRY
jgi:2',3'-cyclic-nucleotide 2'-phosphodiesterase (5'-nucleotidase family)